MSNYRNDKPITGSILARHLMIANTEPVKCFVSDRSDAHAMDRAIEAKVCLLDGRFESTSGIQWLYAVPIDLFNRRITTTIPTNSVTIAGTRLAHFMFDRGHTEVLCYVSDRSDQDATTDNVPVIVVRSGSTFKTLSGFPWNHAVPVDNATLVPLTYVTNIVESKRYQPSFVDLLTERIKAIEAKGIPPRTGSALTKSLIKQGSHSLICLCGSSSEEFTLARGTVREVIEYIDGAEEPFKTAQGTTYSFAITVDKSNKPIVI